MLDLDDLAEKRATQVQEEPERWKSVLWSSRFQKLSQLMSDGEVEELVNACHSGNQLDQLLGYLEQKTDGSQVSPFSLMLSEAKQSGLVLEDWLRNRFK